LFTNRTTKTALYCRPYGSQGVVLCLLLRYPLSGPAVSRKVFLHRIG